MERKGKNETALRRLHALHDDEAYPHVCGTYLSARWAMGDLARRHGISVEQLENDICSGLLTLPLEGSPESRFERRNFRVASHGWPKRVLADGRLIQTNPGGDITELLEGSLAGEQLFTWEAALRETAKAGKRLPSTEDWASGIRAINPAVLPMAGWQDDTTVRKALGLKLAGYRGDLSTACCLQEKQGYYWASSPIGPEGHLVIFSDTQVCPAYYSNGAHSFSVRCLADAG